MRTTGCWFLDRSDRRPPDALIDFLDSGPSPVSVGLGSTIDPDAEESTAQVLEALRRTGQRGVLLTGGGIGGIDLSEEVFEAEEVPHDWLFGRVRAAVQYDR